MRSKTSPKKAQKAPEARYTPETLKRVLDAIRVGAVYHDAARYADIDPDSFAQWMREGEQAASGDLHDLYNAVQKAEAEAAFSWLATIETAIEAGDWHAAAWKLEHRFPELYGRRALEITGKDGGPIRIAPVMSLEEQQHMAERVAAILAEFRRQRGLPTIEEQDLLTALPAPFAAGAEQDAAGAQAA